MRNFDIRKRTRLGYVVLMVAMGIAWTGCSPTAPPAVCGNGAVEAGEQCDPPDGDTCDTDCTIIEDTEPMCGDSVIDPGEDCDPPDGDACDTDCQTIPVGGPDCGNGVVGDGEECEPPGTQTCDASCLIIGDVVPACGDGVVDDGEECDPPGTETCDANCLIIGDVVPVCGDNVIDPGEQCDPPDDLTCDQDCQTIENFAVCGNGEIEPGERCDPPDGILCDDNCQTISAGVSVCGNGDVEAGELCDPPDGDTCDVNCQAIIGGGLANDSCESPTLISLGSHSYSNVGATTDGPVACADFDNPLLDSDIWFCFTAPCDEAITVSLCGSLYDTKMAVYQGCACPTSNDPWVGCSDDDCGAGQESRTTFPGIAGQDYLIRVGGFRGFGDEQGVGNLTIFCGSDPDHGLATCGLGAGGCFTANDSPGCSNVDTCTRTCAADMSCCDRVWDGLCATKADGIANGFDVCGPTAGSCFQNAATPGCEDTSCCLAVCEPGCDVTDCCQSVCEIDPFCCLTDWDDVCADSVEEVCGLFEACVDARGTCFAEHEAPGCTDQTCCNDVCSIDRICCTDTWDDVCTGFAESCQP